ncbi:MAG: hypothetical protein P3X22_006005 [Thermoprotei archaeon]|nr:hypothetical protein [Thermoprotei archaeon]
MALSDLFNVLGDIARLAPFGGSVNISYYMILTGILILSAITAYVGLILAFRSAITVFKKPPSFLLKAVIVLSMALILVGILIP